mmetsp:Transcript_15024/g.31862  ORF Transcript_15024/g.31862 Transcript_15024/m.31862 type:complete len:276 (+) Transcript_15024:38-865(+)
MIKRMTSPGVARHSWVSLALAIAAISICAHGFQLPITSTSSGMLHHPATYAKARVSLQSSSFNSVEEDPSGSNQRRKLIQQSSAAIISSLLVPFSPAIASEEDTTTTNTQQQPSSGPYTRTPSPNDKFKFSYTITPPPAFEPGNKPLKTHLDEINFSPPGVRGYSLGITVDPVRISKIQDFGTPEEVAARVVTAEVNRDGVFEVTLAKDPKEDTSAGCYDIEYISDGKRGRKRFVTRIYITGGFLYVLTVQSKEAEYDKVREAEVLESVKSFRPL